MKKKAAKKASAKKSSRKVSDLKPRKDAKGGADYVLWRKHLGSP